MRSKKGNTQEDSTSSMTGILQYQAKKSIVNYATLKNTYHPE